MERTINNHNYLWQKGYLEMSYRATINSKSSIVTQVVIIKRHLIKDQNWVPVGHKLFHVNHSSCHNDLYLQIFQLWRWAMNDKIACDNFVGGCMLPQIGCKPYVKVFTNLSYMSQFLRLLCTCTNLVEACDNETRGKTLNSIDLCLPCRGKCLHDASPHDNIKTP